MAATIREVFVDRRAGPLSVNHPSIFHGEITVKSGSFGVVVCLPANVADIADFTDPCQASWFCYEVCSIAIFGVSVKRIIPATRNEVGRIANALSIAGTKVSFLYRPTLLFVFPMPFLAIHTF
jgi:hypothetical protein